MKKMTKTQVIAHVKKTGSWKGYLVGSNVAEWHIVNGWSLGYYVELFLDTDRGVCVVGQTDCILSPTEDQPWRHITVPTQFQSMIDDWSYYNANSETGYYAHFYQHRAI